VAVAVSVVALAVLHKSATSAPRLVTLPAIALRPVVTAAVVTEVETKEDTVVVPVTEVVLETVDRPAILVVATVTCLVTAPRAKNATTVAKSAIFPVIAQQRPQLSELATSASNPATSRLNAPTKNSSCLR